MPVIRLGSRLLLRASRPRKSILRVHLIPEMGQLLLSEVNAREIEAYKAKKLSEKLAPKTVNNHLTVLRRMLSVAQEWELIEHVPAVKWLHLPPQKFDFLSFEEAERLVDAADRLRIPLNLSARSGRT